jgi:Fur family ferric uptake transcriptional regulator
MSNPDKILEEKGVKPTANRILIVKALDRFDHPISLAQLEDALETLDKSSIFRSLTKFVEHDIAHVIDDGSGSLKYELCYGEHGHSVDDMHAHFRCEQCGRVFCFESQHIPMFELPEGFKALHANYVIMGICSECSGN